MLAVRLPDARPDAPADRRERRTLAAAAANLPAPLIPLRCDHAAAEGLWQARRALLPRPVDAAVLARSTLIQKALGGSLVVAPPPLNDTARWECMVEDGWRAYASATDAGAVLVGAQVLLNTVGNTAGVAAWMRDLVQRNPDPRTIETAKRLVGSLTNHQACTDAVAAYLESVWTDTALDHPVSADLRLCFDGRYEGASGVSAIAIYHEFMALNLYGLDRAHPDVLALVRQALWAISRYLRPIGLPDDYGSLFDCWHEEEFMELESIQQWIEDQGCDPNREEDVRRFFVQAVDQGEAPFPLYYVESFEHFALVRELSSALSVVKEVWSNEALKGVVTPDTGALTPWELALLQWCENVSRAVVEGGNRTLDSFSDSMVRMGLMLPMLLPEMSDLEDDLQNYFEHYMQGGDDDEYVFVVTPDLPLADAEAVIRRMAIGTRLLAELYDLSEDAHAN